MSEYAIQILNEDGEDVGGVIPLTDYLGGNKNGGQLLNAINDEIDIYEGVDEDENDKDLDSDEDDDE